MYRNLSAAASYDNTQSLMSVPTRGKQCSTGKIFQGKNTYSIFTNEGATVVTELPQHTIVLLE